MLDPFRPQHHALLVCPDMTNDGCCLLNAEADIGPHSEMPQQAEEIELEDAEARQ